MLCRSSRQGSHYHYLLARLIARLLTPVLFIAAHPVSCRQTEAGLKAQVRELQSTTQRAGVDIEYAKNVIVKYMELNNNPAPDPRQLQLLPLVENILEFTPEDVRLVRTAHPGSIEYFG